MAIDLKQFLSAAVKRVLPTQFNAPVIDDVSQELGFVVDLTPQAKRIEWATGSITLTGVFHPRFDFPEVPIDEVHVYHHIGVVNSVGAGAESWRISSIYPGIANGFLEDYSIDTGDENRNFFITGPASNSRAQRNGRPYIVYPSGILRVERPANGALNDVLTCNVLREVLGGPLSSHLVTGQIIGSEV